MSSRQNSRTSSVLLQKMHELEQAYNDVNSRDQGQASYRKMSNDLRNDQTREAENNKEVMRLEYTLSRLDQKLKTAKLEADNAKRDLKNEIEGRKLVEKKMTATEKENKDLRGQVGSLRVRMGVVNANINVGKHETDELKKNNQENQVTIARLEERLAAANKEIERLRDPMNPHGIEEVKTRFHLDAELASAMFQTFLDKRQEAAVYIVKKKITFDKQELKRLKAEVQSLQELRAVDFERIADKENKTIEQHREAKNQRDTIFKLETQLDIVECDLKKERATREEFQRENEELRHEKDTFDETLRLYKVRLGVSEAGKNVNVRQADALRRKDMEYQAVVDNLEKRLRLANVEIERLKSQHMTDKTADSVQRFNSRFKSHRNTFGVEYAAPSSFSSPGRMSSGWSPAITPQRSPNRSPQRSPVRTPKGNSTKQRLSVGNINGVTTNQNGAATSRVGTLTNKNGSGASLNNSTTVNKNGAPSSTAGSRKGSPAKTSRTEDKVT